MTEPTTRPEQETLLSWIDTVYYLRGGEHLTKETFLHGTWQVLSSLVRHNKANPFIQEAVRRHPDLIPRGFAILSVTYGAYASEPKVRSILRDFVRMLECDLLEKEVNACVYAYARAKEGGAFFPELHGVLEKIRAIYSAEHFRLDALPPTMHQAYALYVLNNQDKLGKGMSQEELFGHLSVSDSKMRKSIELVKSTQITAAKR
jgi:hypothetical protein